MARRDDGQKMRSYHCHKCGGFHIGRWRRDGRTTLKRTADHHAGSYKARREKYQQLTEGK